MRCAGYFSTCLVTNRRFLSASAGGERERLAAVVRESLEGGLGAVQLREKDLTAGTLLEYARTVREITAHHGAPLLVNDRVDVALASGAEGVHVGGASLPAFEVKRLAPGLLVGVSCHSVREVQEAEQSGADYVFLGPIYDTPSKRSFGPPLGPDALREASACSRVALIAIGGITPGRAPEAIEAGASGVAVMGWILSAADPRRAAADLAEAVGGARGAALRPPSQSSGDPEAPEARRPAATT